MDFITKVIKFVLVPQATPADPLIRFLSSASGIMASLAAFKSNSFWGILNVLYSVEDNAQFLYFVVRKVEEKLFRVHG